ncbi:SUPPRESSOR OF GAMMA RESPONSE 1-like [Cynara cardunculus var. scolymus]|uniref:SUPPRESSOR OF GAMMA RESPONSE 1-like n=1 Tax=Cynara cardunculus var. scolymus TaxID=59895 RepID=UPI000D62D6B4|nr:SUPPRESSOR OF GAMMA RESPONSE 1-like [Cynara cardunculus var. scolymus]
MAKSWIVDGRGIARKVKTSSLPLVHQIKDCGANRECPQCHCRIDNSDVSVEWPGLPVGVKFEPTDVELLEHLAAKCGVGNEKPHQFIDEFIPTLDVDDGICYKHPENLPGATKDGNSIHFFYRTKNAYTTGQRKRRRICNESGLTKDVRWHKTGKTKAVMQNGVQIGCKKIMVLYGTAGGGSKPCKLNWVMHEYYLGAIEDEKEGQYVVSKIFYQPQKQTEKTDNHFLTDELDAWMTQTSPRTPETDAPDPCRPGKSVSCEDATTDYILQSPQQESGWNVENKYLPSSSNTGRTGNMELPIWEDDSQAIDLDAFDDSLFCNEDFDAYALLGDSRPNHGPQPGSTNDTSGTTKGATSGIADLDNLDMGTPPDFSLADLQFSSQDSIFGWLERL